MARLSPLQQVLRSALVILGILASAGAASAAAAAGGKQQQLGPLLAAVLSSQASGISNSSSSSSVTAALGSHAFPPLDDDDIAIINGAQQQQQPAGAPYLYTSGLPPLEALLNGSTAAHTLSWDQQQQPAAGTERVSWLVRTYTCTGEALLKLRLSNEMQMIIRDAVSESVSAAVNVPQHQVELFASGNISLALSIAGVRWPDSSGGSLAEATPGSHAGLAAVRDALSQLSGGYDKDHIDVSFASPAPAAALVETSTLLAPSPSQAMRKLLLQQQQQQSGEAAAVTVYARFHGMAPANATSLLRRLASTCSPRAPGEHVAPASLVAGTSVTRVCANTFRLAFKDHGVMSSPAAFAVTPVAQPQASVALSVAVALTPSQLAVDKDEQVIEWLNSSSVQDILHDLNLEAVPAGLLSLLNSTAELAAAAAAVESGDKSGGGALAGLLPLLLQQSPAAAAASGGHSVSRGMVAGVVVAGAVSALALIGVGVLLVRQRRPARASAGGLPTSRSSSAQGLRRKRRPRTYATKWLTPPPAMHATAPALPSEEEAAAAERPHIERGDSVSSAVQFEAADATQASDDDIEQPGSSDGTNSSSSSSTMAAASSSQAWQQEQQQHPECACSQSAALLQHCSSCSSGGGRVGGSGSGDRSSGGSRSGGMVSCAAACTGAHAVQVTAAPAGPPASGGQLPSTAAGMSVFAAMGAQLAAAGGSGGNPDAVQPLGSSCWHQHGAACGWGGALQPGEHQQLMLQRPGGAAMVSPFAAAFSIASEASAGSSVVG